IGAARSHLALQLDEPRELRRSVGLSARRAVDLELRPEGPGREPGGQPRVRRGRADPQGCDPALRAAPSPALARGTRDSAQGRDGPSQRALARDLGRAVGAAISARVPDQDRHGSGERRDPAGRGALMDARMLRYYTQELAYMREMGSEFAAAFPKIAARLALDATEVADPYV